MAERLIHLDSLRGIAALCVAGFHAVMTFAMGSPLEKVPVFTHGYLMVDLFFVLSGFVIAYSSTHQLTGVRDAGRFQFRRLLRIYPLHLLTLSVFFLVNYVLRHHNIAAPNDAAAFAANLTLVHPFTETELTFNYPSWSIAAEFWTYLIFAVVTVLVHGRLRRWLGALIALAGFVALTFFDSLNLTQGASILRCATGFFLGVLIFEARGFAPRNPWYAALSLAGVALLFILRSSDQVPDLVFPPAFAVLIYSLAYSRSSIIIQVLNTPPLQRLGVLSFGFYMWHGAVFFFFPLTISGLTGIPSAIYPLGSYSAIAVGPIGQVVLFLAAVSVTLLVAQYTYTRIEKPMMALGRSLRVRTH